MSRHLSRRSGRFGARLALLSGMAFGCTGIHVGCTAPGTPLEGVQTFRIEVTAVNGLPPPEGSDTLPANTGATNETWDISVTAVDGTGKPTKFDGVVRVSLEPGAVVGVQNLANSETLGRNLKLEDGKATARVTLTAMYGDARVLVEDLGYVPAAEGEVAACSNGKNDDEDEDVFVDFPSDPGCEFADDTTETSGTFAAGTSPSVAYAFPTIQDIQGRASETPYPFEAIQVGVDAPQAVIVTRVSKDGFYATDLRGQSQGYNHLFAFNFSTPANMRVCDRIIYMSGTVSEFFGFTELSFPSFRVDPLFEEDADKCAVPEPAILDGMIISDPVEMEKLESGLVRIEGYGVSKFLGPKLAIENVFKADQSNCDLNGDGKIDFESEAEGSCGNACSDDPDCSEWTSFVSRGNYKVRKGSSVIQIQTDGAPEFNVTAHRGKALEAVTGTMRNFSGGNLNWTIETRCSDDLLCCSEPRVDEVDKDGVVHKVCPKGADLPGCAAEAKSIKKACVSLRTLDDNEEGTN